MPDQHLWEIDHPYYCTEGNYYARPIDGLHQVFDSWAEFIEKWGGTDPDMNLVFRWDWKTPDPADYCPPDCGGHDDGDCDEMPRPTLNVYWVLQRKAILRSTECTVTEADEPAVRAWLADRAQTIAAIWEPLNLAREAVADA